MADNVLVLARVDHEEPYWAQDTAKHLTAAGITVEITPRLREAMDEEWTWASYPMPWCTRAEIRAVSNEVQKIHDDIRHGQLLIHAHAHDGHTTVAVGTYLGANSKSVYLHGEDHLRQVADTFDSLAQAMLAFEKVHSADTRPGPAPLTDTERAAAEARSTFDLTAAKGRYADEGRHHVHQTSWGRGRYGRGCPPTPGRRLRSVPSPAADGRARRGWRAGGLDRQSRSRQRSWPGPR